MNRALLVGINAYPRAPLRGCVNDIIQMADFILNNCRFATSDIRLLVDERATTQAILERLAWLISGVRAGDRILFQYSGHGAQMPTRNEAGDVDGLDEVICPVDFDWTDEHMIRDKDFNRLFSSVPDGVEFVWISDSCHSGDLLQLVAGIDSPFKHYPVPADIEWRLRIARERGLKALTFRRIAEELNLALIAGCRSDQFSSDAWLDEKYHGALTYYLSDTLNEDPEKPLKEVVPVVAKKLKENGFDQEPQLEGNETIMARAFLRM